MATAIQQRYQRALEELVETLRQDRYVLAVILCGSLSYDTVWERSDIDLLLVTTEDLKARKSLSLVVDGINVHAMIYPRGQFRQGLQGAIQSSFFHSLLSKSTLLFSKDEGVADLYEGLTEVGARDREIQLLKFTAGVLMPLTKAEKWCRVRQDWHYAFFYLQKGLDDLAAIEILGRGEITTRETLPRAMQLNPEFFGPIYTELMDGPKNETTMLGAIEAIRGYLRERPQLFRPIFEFLREAGGARSATEINHHFEKNWGLGSADFICEWLADEDLIQKVSIPARVVEKSRVTVEEAAYISLD